MCLISTNLKLRILSSGIISGLLKRFPDFAVNHLPNVSICIWNPIYLKSFLIYCCFLVVLLWQIHESGIISVHIRDNFKLYFWAMITHIWFSNKLHIICHWYHSFFSALIEKKLINSITLNYKKTEKNTLRL